MSSMAGIVESPFPALQVPLTDVFSFTTERWEDHPSDLALVKSATGKKYSYSDTKRAIEGSAAWLHSKGFKKGSTIAFYSYNCPEIVMVMLAAWKLGGDATVINPHLTADECHRQLSMTNASFAFSDETHQEKLDAVGEKFHARISPEEAECFASSGTTALSDLPSVEVDPESACLILFSSGTTGKPKPCAISHKNVVCLLHTFTEGMTTGCVLGGLGPDVIYQPMSHIYGIGLTLIGLRAASPAIVMPGFDLKQYLQLLQDYKAPQLRLVPPLAVIFVKNKELVKQFDLSSLKVIQCGAAVLSKDVASSLIDVFPSIERTIAQMYGMTETSGAVCLFPTEKIRKKIGEPEKENSTGVPTFNCSMKVRDIETGALLPPHKVGEICCLSTMNFICYLGNEGATKEAKDADGWIFTGDLGFYDNNGYFYVVDRLKDIIKCNGYQVSPSELEDLLLSHPDITDAGVVGLEQEQYGEVPSAMVVLAPNSSLDGDAIRKFVEGKVASFKRLRGPIKIVPAIPKTGSGKVLRREMAQTLRAERV